jgi:DNA-binding PadR family transcriptional regulator/rRNA processing protein Gar1
VKDTVEERSELLTENPYAGYTVCDYAGEEIGKVDEFFVDGRTEYISVKIDSLEPKSTIIPVDVTRVEEQRRLVELAVSREGIEDALALDDDSETTLGFDQQVQSFFGVTNDGIFEVPPADWIVPLLLVRLRGGECAGHVLARKVTHPGFEAPRPWTIYRALQQMEQEGMIVARGDDSCRELSWRRYSITEWGDTYLEYLANALVEYGEEIDVFFRLYNGQLASEPRLEQGDLQSERETREDAQARN